MKQDTLVFEYSGVKYRLNENLVNRQKAWNNVEAIKETHWLKHVIYDMIRETDDAKLLKSLAQDLTEIEYELQGLWNFPYDANYHRFWEAPKCTCPVIDNQDVYPYMHYRTLNCPLHGDE